MEEKCGSAAICFVAFLPDILDSKAEGRNKHIQQLLTVAEKFKRSPYRQENIPILCLHRRLFFFFLCSRQLCMFDMTLNHSTKHGTLTKKAKLLAWPLERYYIGEIKSFFCLFLSATYGQLPVSSQILNSMSELAGMAIQLW